MARLVHHEASPVGEDDRRGASETPFGYFAVEADALVAECRNRRVDVVAHQIELVVPGFLSGMNAELGGWQREDQPAVTGVDGRKLEHVAKETAYGISVGREHERVHAGDHQRSRRKVALRRYSSSVRASMYDMELRSPAR